MMENENWNAANTLVKKIVSCFKKKKHRDDKNLILAECFNSLRGNHSI